MLRPTKILRNSLKKYLSSVNTFDPANGKFKDEFDLEFYSSCGKTLVPPHIEENIYGQVHRPWLKAHFNTERTLFEVLSNVENFGVNRRVQFRADIDAAPQFTPVDLDMQYYNPKIPYAEDARTSSDYDLALVENEKFINTTFWTISRVVPDAKSPNLDYGIAFGFLTINGKTIPGERMISHCNKPGWLIIPLDEEVDIDEHEPEINSKPLYSPLPPMIQEMELKKRKMKQIQMNEQNLKFEEGVPMMKNVVMRNDPECLIKMTLLHNKHDPDLPEYL